MAGNIKTSMVMNIHIKADVDSLTLSEIYELLTLYTKKKEEGVKLYSYKKKRFEILTTIGLSINYSIKEIR